jgi:membrane protein implicated in regulation of membrane protease activity
MTPQTLWAGLSTIGWPIVFVVLLIVVLLVIVLLCCGVEYRETGPDGRNRHLRIRRMTDRR